MEFKSTYVSITEIERLIDYYQALRKVEDYKANFGKVKLIDEFIENLQVLNTETGVLKDS